MNSHDKAHFIERVSREMEQDLPERSLSTQEALAACCRILAHEGHESGLAGQVTARADKPGSFWTLQFGYGFEEATAERMVLVDEDLKPLSGKSGGGRPNPGTRFHIWIYRKRPDVQAIVHTHAAVVHRHRVGHRDRCEIERHPARRAHRGARLAREFAEQRVAGRNPSVGGGDADEGLAKVVRRQTERTQECAVRRAIEAFHRNS